MNPPLRDKSHYDRLWYAVKNNLNDTIGSDHAPHLKENKDKVYPNSPSGMPGVQTLMPVMLNHVNDGKLTLNQLMNLVCENPIKIFGIKNKGFIKEGFDADFTIVDMNKTIEINNKNIESKCGWSPFDGYEFKGTPVSTIINGQISRSRTWTYALMAKRSGKLVIPPVIIAKERSLPIDILITPQSEAILGEADIFISAELDMDENYVQAQTLLKIKIYRMVQTRQPRLFEPEISGVETLIEIAGDDKNYESVINGKTYDVIERIYALFPQVSGELLIEPIRFEARILKNGSITGRRTYQSSKSIIKVLPIPAPPKDYPNAKWLPAREVKINDEWSRDLQNLKTGEPITRQIKVNAVGQLSTQLPPIDYKLDANLKIYPDKPKLSDNIRAEGIIASRIDQYAMIGISAGKIELPSVNLPWWDIDEKIWKIASLSMQNISIKPSIEVLKEKESVPIIEESELTPNKSNITSDAVSYTHLTLPTKA